MTNLINSRTLKTLAIVSVALFALGVQTSTADVTVTSDTATFPAGTVTGTIDIFVDLTDPELSAPPLLSSYNVSVADTAAAASGGIAAADVALSFNAGNNGNSVVKTDVFPTFDVTDASGGGLVSGASASSPPYPALFDEAGLMSVVFTISGASAGKAGTFDLGFDSQLTKLFDDQFAEIAGVGLSGGTITIVPEPATFGASLLGLLGLLGLRRRLF